MSDLALVTSHFNWCDYKRPKANLERFLRAQERDGIPVYGVEAVLHGQRPVTAGRKGWRQVQVPRHAIMFQKEALLNLAESMVPEEYTKLAWVDADITFENPAWASQTSEALDQMPVVQPFERGIWLGRCGEIIRDLPSMGSIAQYSEVDGHPGFAMAARRELWTEYGGLFPYAISGRGDSIAAAAFLAQKLTHYGHQSIGGSARSLAIWESWGDPLGIWTGGKVGYVPGRVFHDFHGDIQHRQYNKRHEWVDGLDLTRDLFQHPDGWMQWTPEADPVMMAAVADYFRTRDEDA